MGQGNFAISVKKVLSGTLEHFTIIPYISITLPLQEEKPESSHVASQEVPRNN